MTKGHNQSHHKQHNSTPTNAAKQNENRSLKDKHQDKSPEQGRNKQADQSGGTKGKNAI